MALTNKRTGLTVAEEKQQTSEQELITEALATETENAELLMLRALNKQLLVKLTDYKSITDKLYQHIQELQASQNSLSEETLLALSAMTSTVITQLQKATLEHYGQMMASCRIMDKAVQQLSEDSIKQQTRLTEIRAEIKAEAELTRKTVARHTLRSAAILSVALAATAVAITALLFIIC